MPLAALLHDHDHSTSPPNKRRRIGHTAWHHHFSPLRDFALGPTPPTSDAKESDGQTQHTSALRTVPKRVDEVHLHIQTQAVVPKQNLHKREGGGSGLINVSVGLDVSPIVSVGLGVGGVLTTHTISGTASSSQAASASTTTDKSAARNGTIHTSGGNFTTHGAINSSSRNSTASSGSATTNLAMVSMSSTMTGASGSDVSTIGSGMSLTGVSMSTGSPSATGSSPSGSITTGGSPGTGSGSNGGATDGYGSPSSSAGGNGETSSGGGGHGSGPPSTGAIAGGVVGGAAGLAVLLLLAMIFIRWYRRRAQTGHHALNAGPGGSIYTEDAPPSNRGPGMAERAGLAPIVAALPALFTHQGRQKESAPQAERGFTRVSGRKLPSQFSTGMNSEQRPGMPLHELERSTSAQSYRDPFNNSDEAIASEEMTMSPGPRRTPRLHQGGPYTMNEAFPARGSPPETSILDRSETPTVLDTRGSRFTEEV